MRRIVAALLLLLSAAVWGFEPHFMNDPAISPDGEEVCFVYLDMLWTVDWDGGDARCLTSVEKYLSNPQYSPDAEWIAYMSGRDGYQKIFRIKAEGGLAEEVSGDDYSLCDWFPDGKSLLVTRRQNRYKTEYFRLYLNGKLEKIASFSGSFSSLNQKGDKIIFCRRGYPYREKYTGSANGDLWLYNIKSEEYQRLTSTDYTERYPQFYGQSDKVYFGASDGVVFQLYQVEDMDFSSPKQLTKFKEWSLRDLDLAISKERIVFEHFHEVWKYDAQKKKAAKLNIDIKQDVLAGFESEEEVQNRGEIFAVSSDGKLLVFSWKYDLFAQPLKGGDVKRITFNQQGINDIAIMNDNKTVFFTQSLQGRNQLFRFDIRNLNEIELIDWADDKYIEYIQNHEGKLVVTYTQEFSHKKFTAIADSIGQKPEQVNFNADQYYFTLSPDSKYALYSVTDYSAWNRELLLLDLENDMSYSLLKTTDWISSLKWGKDGESAFFSRYGNIYRLDLQPKNEYYYEDEDNWNEILKDEEENEKITEEDTDKEPEEDETEADEDEETKMQIDFNGLKDRIVSIADKRGYNYLIHLTEDMVYYINNYDDKEKLFKIKYNGEDEKELHTFSDTPERIIVNNNDIIYSSREKLFKIPLEGGSPEIIENTIKYEYDRKKLNLEVFNQVWHEFGRGFYDINMHGLNWNKIYKKYLPYIEFAYTPEVLGNIVDEMIGEVNASHTGYYPRKEKAYTSKERAYLGAEFDLGSDRKKGIAFKKVYIHSPLARDYKIKAGDVLLKIDDTEVGEGLPFDALFRAKRDEKITLTIETDDSLKTVSVRGLSYGEKYRLWYSDWVENRRQKVENATGGRIGYSHIRGMDNRSYQKFEDELFSINFDKDALIIDIRFNGGGHTHDSILETLTKKQYGWSSSRWADAEKFPTPRRVWNKPIVLIIDEDSFSDAEIFPILFKHLKLGKIIGMPTSGSVIGTGHVSFMDGSSMRMPSSGWFEMDKKNMEGSGAQPDIRVEMNPQDYINDNDRQLQAAVDELLKELH